MNDEQFLAMLKFGHRFALCVGRVIRECAAKVQCDASLDALRGLPEMVGAFAANELKPHFAPEESLLGVFGARLDPQDDQRIRSEHRYMVSLIQDGSLEALNEFAGVMENHVRFEEEKFYPLLGKKTLPEEKRPSFCISRKPFFPASNMNRKRDRPKPPSLAKRVRGIECESLKRPSCLTPIS
jgi:hypothetical protein